MRHPARPRLIATRWRASALACALTLAAVAVAPATATGQGMTSRSSAAEDSPAYGANAEAMGYADALALRIGMAPEQARRAIAQARRIPAVIRLMQPTTGGTAKDWQAYRSRFVEPVRIRAGLRFWQAEAQTLARAEQTYGVPAEIIVGILGVETLYGQQMGRFRVIDALATLAFDFPPEHPRAAQRQAFFRDELAQFLALTQRDGVDPQTPLGSYAGAMGMPQFMPSSWLRYAVDFDGDGRIDLFGSRADAIGSVAHYFKAFGWRPGLPTHLPVHFDKARLDLKTLLAPDILPTFSVAQFAAAGAVLDSPVPERVGSLALIELRNGDAPPSYVAGTDNFYAITRYNWSSYYAMAVIELGRAVAAERLRTAPVQPPCQGATAPCVKPPPAAGTPG